MARGPGPRPAPPAPSLLDRYQQALGPLALAYAAGTALVTRSPARALEALLLVNPRTALIGAEAASTGAAARVLRAGVTVVGTRPIRRPDALLLAIALVALVVQSFLRARKMASVIALIGSRASISVRRPDPA